MEPTVPPWGARMPWRRVHRIRLGSRARDDYWHAPHLTLWTGQYLRPGDQHGTSRHIIRSEDGPGNRVVFPTPANPWVQHRFPIDTESWRLPLPPPPDFKKGDAFEAYLPDPSAPHPPPLPHPHRSVWSDSTLGWIAGTVLLAFFVIIVRATEKCLDRRLFKARRRQSEEWPTPNVLATSHQHTALDLPPTAPGIQIDPPPPYSECTRPKPQCEEPPPPYTDCYVAFINPKDGIPSAHIIVAERADTGGAYDGENIGTNIDITTNAGINTTPDEANIGLVCDNVIVERSVGEVGANTRSQDNVNQNSSEYVNIDAIGADIGDNEANLNNRVKTELKNAGNGNTNPDFVILNLTAD